MESFQFTANHENNFRLWISKHFSELFLSVNALFRLSEFHLSTNEATAFLWEFFLIGIVTSYIRSGSETHTERDRENKERNKKRRSGKPAYVKTNTKLESIR